MKRTALLLSYSLLLIISYFDNLRGPLLPLIAQEFSLTASQSGLFLSLGSASAFLAATLMIPLKPRFRSHHLAYFALISGLISAFMAIFVQGPLTVYAFGLLAGFAVSFCGTVSNIILIETPLGEHKSRYLCGLHGMYGLGSMLGPIILANTVRMDINWRFLMILPIVIYLIIAWLLKQNPERVLLSQSHEEQTVDAHFSWPSSFQLLVIFTLCLYACGEVMISMWLPSFLVQAFHLSIAEASAQQTLFFFVLTATRLIAFAFLKEKHEKPILIACLVASIFFWMTGRIGWSLGFGLSGVLGPFFPMMLSRISRLWPKQAGNLTILVILVLDVCLVLCHMIMGSFSETFGFKISFFLAVLTLLASLGLLILSYKIEERRASAKLQTSPTA